MWKRLKHLWTTSAEIIGELSLMGLVVSLLCGAFDVGFGRHLSSQAHAEQQSASDREYYQREREVKALEEIARALKTHCR
jgi:hypothetical protein